MECLQQKSFEIKIFILKFAKKLLLTQKLEIDILAAKGTTGLSTVQKS